MSRAGRIVVKVVIVVAAVAALLVVTALIIGPDKKALNDEVRRQSGSDFMELPEGLVEYEVAGPEDGPPVILVHGLSVPMYDWDRQMSELGARGFRVLRYNQYGRGLSDRPRGRYDLERYTGQVKDIADAMGWGRVNLVAHSMGGVIAAGFAAAHPEMVDRIVLIAPALHMAQGNTGIALVRIPLLGDFAAKVMVPGSLAGRADALFREAGVASARAYSQAFREQMTYRGFTRSVKSLFRGDVVADQSDVYSRLDGERVLLIHGGDDDSVPEAHFAALAGLLPGMERIAFEGVGHMPNMEDAQLVNELIADFLSR